MPAPQASAMKQFARLKFSSFNLVAPPNWQQPQGEAGDHFREAFRPNEMSTAPGIAVPPLFTPATPNRYHTDSQKMLTAKVGGFLDKTCEAICSAWSTWQSAASMVGIIINGPTASGGQVVGPPIGPLILAQGAKASPMELKYTNAIANTIGTAWLSYTATIKVAAMPWYPAFVMVPSPVAPPSPNVPCPVAALTQVPVSLSPAIMKQQMMGMFADPTAAYASNIFEAICDAFDKVFTIWKTSTMVTNVVGTGPVPTFAPPYVPGGPVVGGVGTMPPGGFA